MKNVTRKLGLLIILTLGALFVFFSQSEVVLADEAGSKANIEFTEAWDPKDPEPTPDPTPKPGDQPTPTPNPPKKGVSILPQTSEISKWQYSVIGVLLIGAGVVIKLKTKQQEEF